MLPTSKFWRCRPRPGAWANRCTIQFYSSRVTSRRAADRGTLSRATVTGGTEVREKRKKMKSSRFVQNSLERVSPCDTFGSVWLASDSARERRA